MHTFEELRAKNNTFIYREYKVEIKDGSVKLTYFFDLTLDGKTTTFIHKLTLKNNNFDFNTDMENIYFHIGLAESISYYKIAAPQDYIIRCAKINTDQIKWFQKLFFNGLGEFIYLNKIDITQDSLVHFICDYDGDDLKYIAVETKDANIIPIGGGKDSLVSYELLKDEFDDTYLFSMNPIVASKNILDKHPENSITLKRELDIEKIIKFNNDGYLNGHIPFSSILGFISIWVGLLYKTKYIILSNEASASEENIIYNNQKINHQYSKSFEFENDFRDYISTYITKDVEYFSFLRPLDEIHIGKLFALKAKEHFNTFRSCNVGSKKNIWCAKCSKCLFTYIMLCNEISDQKLEEIFGSNMLDDETLLETFTALSQDDEVKPFDCVGTYDEVNYALSKKQKTYSKENMPKLLKDYKAKNIAYGFNVELEHDNNLPNKFRKILDEALKQLNK